LVALIWGDWGDGGGEVRANRYDGGVLTAGLSAEVLRRQ
jgi:hypothetical protein